MLSHPLAGVVSLSGIDLLLLLLVFVLTFLFIPWLGYRLLDWVKTTSAFDWIGLRGRVRRRRL